MDLTVQGRNNIQIGGNIVNQKLCDAITGAVPCLLDKCFRFFTASAPGKQSNDEDKDCLLYTSRLYCGGTAIYYLDNNRHLYAYGENTYGQMPNVDSQREFVAPERIYASVK